MNESGCRVVVHMGMGKTGTTALQVAFVRGREHLARVGVNYPSHPTDVAAMAGKVMSGNGMGIVEAMAPRTHDPDEAVQARRDMVSEALRDGFHTTLYSSEFLYSFAPKSIVTTRDELVSQNVELDVVVYVRNMLGHAVSSYSQAVKRGLYTGTFRDYIDRDSGGPYRPVVRRKIESLLARLGSDHVHVIHYDSVRDDLVPHFCEHVLGIDRNVIDLGDVGARVNRSLTGDEIALMRHINRSIVGKRRAHLLGDLMIEQPPLGPKGVVVARRDYELMCEYYAEDMEWLNDVFFPDTRPVAVAADDVAVSDELESSSEPSEREQHLLRLVVELANRLIERPEL